MSVVVLMVVIFLPESSLKVCGADLPVVINTWPFTEATGEGMIPLHTTLIICQEYYYAKYNMYKVHVMVQEKEKLQYT